LCAAKARQPDSEKSLRWPTDREIAWFDMVVDRSKNPATSTAGALARRLARPHLRRLVPAAEGA
jgi:hypothetical protein